MFIFKYHTSEGPQARDGCVKAEQESFEVNEETENMDGHVYAISECFHTHVFDSQS